MKWNWGTKLMLAMAAFMIMVILFGIRMFREGVELVEKDYYPKGQAHQQLIDKRNNAKEFSEKINITHGQGVVKIYFPEELETSKITGEVHFYQRVNEQYDRFVKLSVDTAHCFSYPSTSLKGRYIVKIDWAYDGKAYYTEKTIDLH